MTFVPKRGLLNKGVFYQPNERTKIVPTLQLNAREFFQDQMKMSAREGLFKNLLQHEVTEGINSIDKELKKSVTSQFPFILTPQTFPKEMRYLLYAARQNYDFELAQTKWFDDMNQQTFNDIVSSAIYESLKFQKPYLALALDRMVAIRGYIDGLRTQGTLQAQQTEMQRLKTYGAGFLSKLNTMFKSGVAYMANALLSLDARLFQDSASTKLFNDTIVKAKVYGDLVINCAYLEEFGLKEMKGNHLIMFDPVIPQLRFQITNAKVVVYLENNGVLSEIQQSKFTMDFLRGLLKTQYIVRASNVIKNYNLMVDADKKNMENKQNFEKYFYRSNRAVAVNKPYQPIP